MREQIAEPREYYDEPEGDGYDWDYEPEDHGQRPKILWGRVVSLVIFMLLAFFLGRSMGGGDEGPTQAQFDDLQAELNSAETTNETLEAQVKELQADIKSLQNTAGEDPDTTTGEDPPEGETKEYIVKANDTLDEIIQKHYGCLTYGETDLSTYVASANASLDPTALHVGETILLPPPPSAGSCS